MKQLTFNRTSKFTFFPIPEEDFSPNFIFLKSYRHIMLLLKNKIENNDDCNKTMSYLFHTLKKCKSLSKSF